jgi:hypothetical protein
MSARISYVAAARLKDRAVLCSNFSTNIYSRERSEIETAFFAALQAEGQNMQGSARKTRQVSAVGGKLFMMADGKGQIVFTSCINDPNFSDRLAWQLVDEFMKEMVALHGEGTLLSAPAESLSRASKKAMRDLMAKYDAPVGAGASDKTTEVRQKVEQVQGIMQENVKRMLDNQTNVESLEEKTDGMSKQANQFLKQSVDLRRQMQLRNLKLKIILGIIVTAVLVYIIVAIFHNA